jgi:hypothetical protein
LFEAEEAFWREVTKVVLKGELPVVEKQKAVRKSTENAQPSIKSKQSVYISGKLYKIAEHRSGESIVCNL